MKPDTDNYLCMKRIKQLYMELYKTENVNVQMKLKPLWFGLFLILIET